MATCIAMQSRSKPHPPMSEPGTRLAAPRVVLDALSMPLRGMRLIEASAGTGKTYTLASLYLRLVIGEPDSIEKGDGLNPPQILVMTYTEAATAELRSRIRSRLVQAQACFVQSDQAPADDFLAQLRKRYERAHWPLCAQRLSLALQWMDDAAIFTIHGWSSRMLRTHAFDSDNLFEQAHVEDSNALQMQAVRDYWRRWYYPLPLAQLEPIMRLAKTPEALWHEIDSRWKNSRRAPGADSPMPAVPAELLASWARWRDQLEVLNAQSRRAANEEALDALKAAADAKVLKKYPRNHMSARLAHLARWRNGEAPDAAQLRWFALNTLRDNGWQDAGQHDFFSAVQALCDHLGGEPAVGPLLLDHAQRAVAQAYQDAKTRLAQFDFDDLLQRLYVGVQQSERLVQAIRNQYPVALVDEFQDTDPWQFGTLWRLYGERPEAQAGLILIGDPKQAIYSFRGADLDTYLRARDQVQGIYTLRTNHRSTAELVAAVNHVFSEAVRPFGTLEFEPANARGEQVTALELAGVPQRAITVWQHALKTGQGKQRSLRELADLCASEMVRLLEAGASGDGCSSPVEPGDMAVLVRNGQEAASIRAALSVRGVRSVYLSERDSVYASDQAKDLWRLMRALAQPGSMRLMRAALCTRLWGLSWDDLQRLFSDEEAWELQVEQFQHWREVWHRQGFLPMLHQLIHGQALPRRWLQADKHLGQDGQRLLTNVLHLGELLQSASLKLQGPSALIRYLQKQIERPGKEGEAEQLRLEGDERLVQVVTQHKAKGLQYPLVFLPFVSAFGRDSPDEGQERLDEDMRLLYVAMTRAQRALWMAVAPFKGDMDGKQPEPKTALSRLLGRQSPDDLTRCLSKWAACEHIQVVSAPAPTWSRFTAADATTPYRPARTATRVLHGNWRRASFSSLLRTADVPGATEAASERESRLADAQIDNLAQQTALAQEAGEAPCAYNDFPAGSRYGTLLHDLLEWQAQQGWPLAGDSTPGELEAQWRALIQRKTQGLPLSDEQLTLLQQWLRRCVMQILTLERSPAQGRGLSLSSLSPSAAWPEMGFTLSLGASRVSEVDLLISHHIWPGQPREPLAESQLQGTLVGFMDLVFEHEGRFYVLDYKSNRLASYAPENLQTAMLAHRYDLQMSLYVLALHRLLRSRLKGYDYDQHMGGAVYWFVRGVDQNGQGVLHHRPARALIEAMDRLFGASLPETHEAAS